MNNYKTKYHRNGTVTIWNVYTQTWVTYHAASVPDKVMASLGNIEREKIRKHGSKT